MHWLTSVYTIAGSFGFLLSLIHFLVWTRNRGDTELLMAAIMAMAASISAIIEINLLTADTVARYQALLLWQNFFTAILLVSMVWFVHTRLGTGRAWLAWSISAAWLCGVVVNFVGAGTLTFSSIDTLSRTETFWGEPFTVVGGTAHPFKIVVDLATLAIMAFVLDATVRAYRLGRHRAALVTGGSILFFILAAGIHTPLVDAGVVRTPFMISLAFVAITIALAYDLVDEIARSSANYRKLQVQRRRWQTLLDRVELVVARVDRSGQVAYVNPFFRHVTGKDEADLIGQPAVSVLNQVAMRDLAQPDLTLPQEESVRSRVSRPLATAQGPQRDVTWFSVELEDENGDYDGFISFGEDVTDQNRTNEELLRLQSGLDKLTKAVMVGELASSFAHELSQPISAVLSNAQSMEILRRRPDTPETELDEILQDIIADTRRARDLMDRVRGLMFNKPPTKSAFDLSEAVNEVLEMLRHDLSTKRIVAELEPDDHGVPVVAARLELQQVIMNLVLNAMQAIDGNDSTDRRILIKLLQPREDLVSIIVDDTGPGIDPSLEKTIFEPFVSSKETGTGIGLAVVRRIVERHAGRIDIGASPEGGARFDLSMRIAVDQLEADVA